MSVSGRSTSSKTRCSGSANDVAVYCMRGVRSSAPHAHSGNVAGAGRRRGRQRASAAAASTATTRPAAITPGAIDPCRPGSRTTAPKSVNSTVARLRAARRAPGAARARQPSGATASTTQAAAAMAMPASMLPGASRACGGRLAARAREEADPECLDHRRHPQSRGERDRADRQRRGQGHARWRARAPRGSATGPAATR